MSGDFLSRDARVLAERIDSRLDQVCGLRYEHFAAAANLRMSARIDALDTWRAERGLSLTACVARATALALGRDPLFACAFDGRDRLERPARLSLGVSVDTGDLARTLVIEDADRLSAAGLGERIRQGARALRAEPGVPFRSDDPQPAPAARARARWLEMKRRELRERFDYLLPSLQYARFEAHRARNGDFCIHNIGTLNVQDFKGFLRRPAVAALWVLSAYEQVVPVERAYGSTRRLPAMLVYGQEIVGLDRACAFLGAILSALEDPSQLDLKPLDRDARSSRKSRSCAEVERRRGSPRRASTSAPRRRVARRGGGPGSQLEGGL
ncbi:MAG: hypothetical protein JXR96_23730 [Deltaproteobacteria bacterium]|nr:hypothetical protein [Deltaproteobacteria bacterium]